MKIQSFIVNNREEELDLLQTIEREMPEVRYRHGKKPTEFIPLGDIIISFPYLIQFNEKIVGWGVLYENPSAPSWQIGQSLSPFPKSALEQLLEIHENEDGSITISKELKDQLKMELKGGEK